MITCVIPYTGNEKGLTALLVTLQPQLHPDDDIYIIDSSPNRSGLGVVALYGTTRSFIFVEVGDYDNDQKLQFGIQSAMENKQKGVLVLDESSFISQTFIGNLKKAIKLMEETKFNILAPTIKNLPYPKMDSDFRFFNSPTVKLTPSEVTFLSCYYFNTDIAGDEPILGVFENEIAVVLPYKPPENKP